MFIVLEPFGHFVVGEVVQEVQLLEISTDPKQRKMWQLSHPTNTLAIFGETAMAILF